MERKSLGLQIFIHVAALILGLVILAPLIWLFVMSVAPAADLAAKPLKFWPSAVDFSRYAALLSRAENSAGAALSCAFFGLATAGSGS